ncbi:MAG: hypothetical protein EOP49_17750 [Sphingobacteriales bacterium]|nr:MAG: hypothetical protein EOP49_17750 [Sphingobacteriales bacterium]
MYKILLPVIFSLLVPIAAFPQVDTLPVHDSVAITNKAEQEIDALEVPVANPSADKIQYISEITRYGFKNLFSKFRYNPALPYSSQVNPHAEGYMQDYLQRHSGQLEKMRGWGTPYFNLIDQVFSQYGLPRELKYLAVIESNLQTSATSWAGAGGPWQFMPYTARDYGLVVNDKYDERRDYLKSTHAAARCVCDREAHAVRAPLPVPLHARGVNALTVPPPSPPSWTASAALTWTASLRLPRVRAPPPPLRVTRFRL